MDCSSGSPLPDDLLAAREAAENHNDQDNISGVEIGVGTGLFAVPLGILIGVEPSPRMAELARYRGIEVLENVAEELPFADLNRSNKALEFSV
jgi:SAM-dependent methyltransferase